MGTYLTIIEAADLARVSTKRLRNLMSAGVLVVGVHYTRPRGLAPRFKREALVAWLEGEDRDHGDEETGGRQVVRPQCKLDLSQL
jgi:Helix-turn-helix domain